MAREPESLTCPGYGRQTRETMPEDACVGYFEYPGCGMLLRPKPGGCCVFCSYGSTSCLPVQREGEAGGCCG